MNAALGSLISPFNVLSLLVNVSRDALTWNGTEQCQLPSKSNVNELKNSVRAMSPPILVQHLAIPLRPNIAHSFKRTTS